MLHAMAAQAAIALDNARLYQAATARGQRLTAVSRLTESLTATLGLDEVLSRVTGSALELFGSGVARLWLLDEDGQHLTQSAVAGARAAVSGVHRLRLGEGLIGQIAARRQSLVIADLAQDPRLQNREWVIAEGTTSFAGVPLVLGERLLGVLSVAVREARRFGAEDVSVLQSLANHAAIALDHARLFTEVQERLADNRRRVEELSALHELSRAVTGQLDEAGVLEAVVQQIGRVLDARDLMILLAGEPGAGVAVAVRIENGKRRPASAATFFPPETVGLGRVVLEGRRPIRTEDHLAECARHNVTSVRGSEELPYWMGVPMIAGEHTLGAVVLRGRDRPFTQSEERLLTNLADLAALALRSAQLFAERTKAYADLAAAHEQLVRSEKLRALGEMASGVAHDFNNVLTSILGRAQLLLRHIDDPKLRRWIETIERSALDGAHSVRRLQEFTRIRRDQPFAPVDLNQVVRDALDVTESRWGAQAHRNAVEIRVETALDPRRPHVPGHAAELREALVNLILNAVDAMPGGGALVLRTAETGDRVELAVSDTGVGIPADLRGKIFDPFFTTKGPKGTGLGLSMTYGILTRHEAQVTVESAPGRGTTFLLSFPRAAPHLDPPTAAAAPPRPSVPALRCLVVDDELQVGEVLGELLASAGHQAVVCSDGNQAMAQFGQERFDVVFTDLSMPGLSGWQVARAVKSRAPQIPVFLVTGFGAEVSSDDLHAHGIDAVLAKPLRVSELLGALADVGARPSTALEPGGRERVEWRSAEDRAEEPL
jgi:signal transduction histidine kinase/ActR/RegA family two-component response regulator/putative methionine-R-sulfoxide reductase with GAF domain